MNEQKASSKTQDLSTEPVQPTTPNTSQPNSKRPLIIAIGIILALFHLAGGNLLFKQNSANSKIASIKSFEECEKAGYPVLQSDPGQCGVPGGKMFYGPRTILITPKATANANETANWKTYTNSQYNFAFQYPKSFSLVTPQSPYYTLDTPLVSITNQNSFYKAPNYNQDANFTVSIKKNYTSGCFFTEMPSVSLLGKKTLGGVVFYGGSANEAAAGNLYEVTMYRTIKDGTCFDAASVVHTGSDWNNIDKDAVERSKDTAKTELNQILSTFKFTKQPQAACSIINTHNGTVFTLEVSPYQQGKTPVAADVLNSQNKLLQRLNLSGPYDSISSPGEKVYNATVPYEKVTGFKFVKLPGEDKNGNSAPFTLKLEECTKGIE